MSDSNPLNRTLPNKLQSLDSRVSALERSRQPYMSVWRIINEPCILSTLTDPVTSNIFNVLTFTNSAFDPRVLISIGDPIRINTVFFFYCIAITATSITVYAGSDYSLVGGTSVTDLAYSNSKNAIGFPGVFNFLPHITAPSGTYTNLDASQFEVCKFGMEGTMATLFCHMFYGNIPTGPSELVIRPPMGCSNFYIDNTFVPNYAIDNYVPNWGVAKFGGAALLEVTTLPTQDPYSVQTGNGAGFTFVLSYLIA